MQQHLGENSSQPRRKWTAPEIRVWVVRTAGWERAEGCHLSSEQGFAILSLLACDMKICTMTGGSEGAVEDGSSKSHTESLRSYQMQL